MQSIYSIEQKCLMTKYSKKIFETNLCSMSSDEEVIIEVSMIRN